MFSQMRQTLVGILFFKSDLALLCRHGNDIARNKFSVKALNDGVMTVKLTGPYTGNEPGVKNIQFIQLFINGKPQVGKYVIVSFASPKVMTVRCRAGETVTFDFLAQITAREVSK